MLCGELFHAHWGRCASGFLAICVVMRSARSAPMMKTKLPFNWLKKLMLAPLGINPVAFRSGKAGYSSMSFRRAVLTCGISSAAERHQRIVDERRGSGWSGRAGRERRRTARGSVRGSMSRTMKTMRVRRSSSGQPRSCAAGWNTCCTPWITTGVSGVSAIWTMPFTRSRLGPCTDRSNSRNSSKAEAAIAASVASEKDRTRSSCRLTSW